jgi:ribosomal-protein-serine acetyltransferase
MQIIKVNENILLKQIVISDAKDIFETIDSQRIYLRKWLPFVDMTKQFSDTEKFIKSIYSVPIENKELVFVIHYNQKFAGLIGFKSTDRMNKKTEIGYWLSETCQKKGIITESLVALINFAFNDLDLNRIQIKCAIGNIPSKNIPKRLNFEFEGIERDGEILSDGEYTDVEIYSLIKRK